MTTHVSHVTDYDGNEMEKPAGAFFSVAVPVIAALLSLALAIVVVATTR